MKQCPECSEPIRGRADKKFCSDLCRNTYNNNVKMNDNRQISAVNSILKKNRRILQQVASQRNKKVAREALLRQGFNFEHFTGLTNSNGINHFCCYEYGYYEMEGGLYKVKEVKLS